MFFLQLKIKNNFVSRCFKNQFHHIKENEDKIILLGDATVTALPDASSNFYSKLSQSMMAYRVGYYIAHLLPCISSSCVQNVVVSAYGWYMCLKRV